MAAREIRLIAFGFLLALASSFGQTFFIALFGGQIRAELGLSHSAFGGAYSAATLASGLLMLWVGAALDRVSLVRYAACATVVLACACLLLAATSHVLLLVLALFGLRLGGQGMMSHAAITGMARAFSHNRGKAIAFASLGMPAGEALLPVIAVSAAATLGWRSVWLVAALALVVVMPTACRLLGANSETPPASPRSPTSASDSVGKTRGEVVRDRRFHLMVPALIGPSFIVTGLFFHQVHLATVKGWELSWIATCFAGYAAASTVAVMVTGSLVDRLGAVRLMPVYLLPLTLGCAVLAFGRHDMVALAFMALSGLTSGASATVVTAMWAEVYGIGHLGAIRALAASLSVVASALAPAFMGWLIDASVSMEAIALGAAIYLVGATLSVTSACLRPAAARNA